MNLENISKDELEKMQIAKENEYQLSMESLSVVEVTDAELSRKIATLQLERKNLSVAMIQGKFNLRRVASELRNIKTMIYRRLGGL